ncbi:MAG TPA: hypothetical protein VIA18_04925 [Polyangia bacterium]|jgi:hypothetical protein|nr:hypothetical protein [Polyangia bacterium]
MRTGGAPTPTLDRWTIGAMAVIAYALADLLHEGAGHGGACLAVHCTPTAFNTSYFNYDESTVSVAARRFIEAAGTLVNVAVGALALLALRLKLPARTRYFVWLFSVLNFITGCGYLAYSGVIGVGDWSAILDGMPHRAAWRVAEAVVGLALYLVVAPRLTWPGLAPFVGAGDDRVRRVRALTLVPYFAGCTTLVAAGAFNPLGARILLISAVAASFGGSSLLAWYYPGRAEKQSLGAPATLGITRSRA